MFLALAIATASSSPAPLPALCRIIHRHTETTAGIGSGTAIRSARGRTLILTCRHVCPDPGRGILVTVGDRDYRARFVVADPLDDLAVIEILAELPPATIAAADPGEGAALRQVGFSGRWTLPVPRAGPALGRLVAGGRPTLAVGTAVRSGDSGSGVFDARGHLVGVCWARVEPAGPAWCVPASEVRRFLASVP